MASCLSLLLVYSSRRVRISDRTESGSLAEPCQQFWRRSAPWRAASILPVACTMETPRELSPRLGRTVARKLGGRASSTMTRPRKRLSMCGASGTSSERSSAVDRSLVNPMAICSDLIVSGYSCAIREDTSSRSLCFPSSARAMAFLTKRCMRPGSSSSSRLRRTSAASRLLRYSLRIRATFPLKAGTCWLLPQLDASLLAAGAALISFSSHPWAQPSLMMFESACRALGQSSSVSSREPMTRRNPFEICVWLSSPDSASCPSSLRTGAWLAASSMAIVTACFTSSCR
mmetsp:Transcript_40168/g.95428  ORF Transcript_40168/g.95428 Transcript_40168/m.95428 type:complete len:288 (+) Transcript_40168:538-1401(+)